MSKIRENAATRLTSLAELGTWYGLDATDEDVGDAPQDPTPIVQSPLRDSDSDDCAVALLKNTVRESDDVMALSVEMERFDPEALLANLIIAAEQDDVRRAHDLAEYERHEALAAELREAEGEYHHAVDLRERAEAIHANAWTVELRARAERAVVQLRRDETIRAERVAQCRAEVEEAGSRLHLERLRVERARQEQRAREKTATAERAKATFLDTGDGAGGARRRLISGSEDVGGCHCE